MTVYWPVIDFAGCVELTCWLIVTRKVIDVGLVLPNELIESIVPLPVDTCLSAVRGPATPERAVVVLQGRRLLRGHQAAELGAVGGGVLRVAPGGVVRGEGDRGLRRRGQVRRA